MKLTALTEATVSHSYPNNKKDSPGVLVSIEIAKFLQDKLTDPDTVIQIIGRQAEWSSTVKVNKNSRNIEIEVKATEFVMTAEVFIPGSVGFRPGVPQRQKKRIGVFDLMDPESFEKISNAAVKYLTN